MINVHITDDHEMVVELLIPVINASGFSQVTGFSNKLSECRKALAFNQPDVLLLDINMPDGDGVTFCAEIHSNYPQLKIIALTCHDEQSCVLNMFKNGASGYITKNEAVSEVLEAIHAVMNNEQYISRKMEQILKKTTKEAVTLSLREMETLQHVAKGLSDPQIAEQMEIALSTVLSFQKKLHLKLGAKNRIELVDKARKEGFIK